MSIRKVSDLDSYLSVGTTPASKEEFSIDNFRKSLFEISKKNPDNETAISGFYKSTNINGDDLLSAMAQGLTGVFANISALGIFNKKLALVLDLFETDSGVNHITNINFTGNNLTAFNVGPIINGTAKHALWS